MGQKTNPIIFQLGKTKKWEYTFEEKKQLEFAKYTENHYEIQKFIKKYFETHGLKICGYNLFYANGTLTFFITFFLSKTFFNTTKLYGKKKLKKKNNFIFFRKAMRNYFASKNIIKILTQKSLLRKQLLSSRHQSTNIIKLFKDKSLKKIYLKNSFIKKLLKKKIIKKKTFKLKRKYKYKKKYNKYKKKKNIYNKNKKIFKKRFKKLKKKIKYTKKYITNNYLLNLKTISILKNKKIKNFDSLIKESFLFKMIETIRIFDKSNSKIVLNFKQINHADAFTKTQLEIFKKTMGQMWRFNRANYYNEGLNVIFLFIKYPHFVDFFSEYIASEMQNHKRQLHFLNFIKRGLLLLNKSKICAPKSIFIQIKGRFNSAPRSKIKTIQIGEKIPIIRIKTNIYYAEKTSFSTDGGTFGVKTWIKRQDYDE